mmetsp:Transcript_26295/g.66607  ORF Transcript_26295/g.66607 Transcript_26295/m.66607 type:complete len:362 (-) Transcript_26295:53-1138(-)
MKTNNNTKATMSMSTVSVAAKQRPVTKSTNGTKSYSFLGGCTLPTRVIMKKSDLGSSAPRGATTIAVSPGAKVPDARGWLLVLTGLPPAASLASSGCDPLLGLGRTATRQVRYTLSKSCPPREIGCPTMGQLGPNTTSTNSEPEETRSEAWTAETRTPPPTLFQRPNASTTSSRDMESSRMSPAWATSSGGTGKTSVMPSSCKSPGCTSASRLAKIKPRESRPTSSTSSTSRAACPSATATAPSPAPFRWLRFASGAAPTRSGWAWCVAGWRGRRIFKRLDVGTWHATNKSSTRLPTKRESGVTSSAVTRSSPFSRNSLKSPPLFLGRNQSEMRTMIVTTTAPTGRPTYPGSKNPNVACFL